MSENPYASPTATGPSLQVGDPGKLLGQVKAIAICSIVQGALEIVLGGIYIAMGFLFQVIEPTQGAGGGQMPADQQEWMMTVMTGVYAGMGGLAIVIGGLRIIAGVQNLRLRGRVFAIIMFFAGLANVMTCYCLPTAIGLCVWGCIIYFNPGVVQAFNSAGRVGRVR